MNPAAWDAFAKREPYFAVLTHTRYLREQFDPAAEAEFFESGEEYVSDLYAVVRTRVFAPLTVLEYGCGVGRLLLPFARRATHVTGVDISPAMLETARMHLNNAGIKNVELLTELRDDRTFDLVNCFLVLQRLRPSEGLELLQRLARRVREGGMGVFHFPYRTNVSPLVSLARAARSRVPGVNAIANLVRRKPASFPFIESNAYDLNEVFAVLQDAGFDSPHVWFTRHGDLDSVIVHALRRAQLVERRPLRPPAPEAGAAPQFIDVKQLIAETSIEELNRTAEAYFASLTEWEDHLAKPFSRAEDAPQLLINLGLIIQGLNLTPGMTVLEFGAGTGWLAHFLTQLGCRMILLDVSPTALNIARELFVRQPSIGTRPEPQFLVFDGRHIDLPDASVDRIVCFDSFHHAPNPDDVLREFGRVLKPAGIAAFAEPGPQHSMTAQSQYEMRTYGVVENDIDIHALWATAQRLGFSDLKLAASNVPPFHVPLAEFDDLLEAGDTYARWAESTRAYLHNVRVFFLTKAGLEEIDSRHPVGLRAAIEASLEGIRLRARIRNIGRAKWLPSDEPFGGVSLGAHLYDAGGQLIRFDYAWQALPAALAPQEETAISFDLPPLEAGQYVIELDCVANKVTWFAQTGSTPARIELTVGP